MQQLMRSCGGLRSATSGISRPAATSVSLHSSHRRSLATHAAADSSYMPSRSYANYSVYKGKGAMSMQPIVPTWEGVISQKGNAIQNVKRPGVLLLEFANVLGSTGAQTSFGNRNYDWGNKLTISLNVTELAQLSELPVNGTMMVYHDPDKNTPQENTRGKKLQISPTPQADGSFFFSISGRGANGQQQVSVPVAPPEMKVLRCSAEFLIPRLMGFDEMLFSTSQQAQPMEQ
ncbi:whirly transcription factor-domain-containing protein [Dunaliella salina]|uniref:Whirly transcription factor-domain-containing protein n=1 Tax=Dunaliella salina TaxID=3046 RepID=A0ABQ7GM88_DUNSA|nr:whirly transcription factor-domain-containing protein [Dunaliella salina]|eukprot:KAF5835724.1 whirly transcription factor-domain-containing protein [Dunaliella salina]